MGVPARLPIFAEVDGTEVVLRAGVDPLVLIIALSRGSWWDLFAMMDADDELSARLADPRDPFALTQARELAIGVAEALCGYPWYTACSLAATALVEWQEFDGLAAYRGFDTWSAPVGRTLALVHHCLSLGCKDDVERALLAYRLAGPEADESATPAGEQMAQLEASNFGEWAAAFDADGSLKT